MFSTYISERIVILLSFSTHCGIIVIICASNSIVVSQFVKPPKNRNLCFRLMSAKTKPRNNGWLVSIKRTIFYQLAQKTTKYYSISLLDVFNNGNAGIGFFSFYPNLIIKISESTY
jgi:hypothetical protein